MSDRIAKTLAIVSLLTLAVWGIGTYGPSIVPDVIPYVTPVDHPNAFVMLIAETDTANPVVARIQNNQGFWNSLSKDRGLQWRFVDPDQKEIQGYLPHWKDDDLPVLFIFDAKTGGVLHVGSLPPTVDAIDEVVKKVTGR